MKKLMMVLLALGLVGGLLAGAAVAEEEAAKEEAKVTYGKGVGDLYEPVKIADFDGKEVDTGKVAESGKAMFVVVNSVCNLCAAEMNALTKHKDKFTSKANVYLVAVDMNKERAASKYKQYAKDFTVLYDPDFSVGNNADLYSTPSTLILDKGGKILYKGSGFKPAFMKKYLEVL